MTRERRLAVQMWHEMADYLHYKCASSEAVSPDSAVKSDATRKRWLIIIRLKTD